MMVINSIVVTQRLLDFLHERRIFTSSSDQARLKIGEKLEVSPEAVVEPYAHILAGHRLPSAIGAFSYSFSRLDSAMTIGRYCSISWDVAVMGSAHASGWVTTHPLSHNPHPLRGVRAYLVDRDVKSFPLHTFGQGAPGIDMGHDVWIGADVMLKRGIAIGTGAIVGARSLVTHDVPPFAIVGGVPARIIRYRFDEALIARLRASEWWRYGPDVIHSADMRDPARFLDNLERAIAGGARPMDLTPIRGEEIIAAAGKG